MSKKKNNKRDETRDYIKGVDFFNEQMRVLELGEITDELGQMFMLLATRYANHSDFNRYYHIRSDMIMAGVEACCRDAFKFRPNRNILERDEDGVIISSTPVPWDGKPIQYRHDLHYNPLAFYTTVIRRPFINMIMKEYNQRNVVNKMLLENGLDADEGYIETVRMREEKAKEEEEKRALEEEKLEKNAQKAVVW